jgi:hypothetical protein
MRWGLAVYFRRGGYKRAANERVEDFSPEEPITLLCWDVTLAEFAVVIVAALFHACQ